MAQVEVFSGPGCDDFGGIVGIGRTAHKVVGIIKRDEGFGVLRGEEDLRRVFDAHDAVGGGVHDEKGGFEVGDVGGEFGGPDIFDKACADADRAAAEHDVAHALRDDLIERIVEIVGDMFGVEGRADGDDGFDRRDLPGCAQHRCPAERVADDEGGRHAAFIERVGGSDQVGDVGGEGGVLELAPRMAKPGEVEPQHRDALGGQARGDAARGGDVLAAGEAMGQHRGRKGGAIGQVEARGEQVPGMAGEGETFGWHGCVPSVAAMMCERLGLLQPMCHCVHGRVHLRAADVID